MRLLGTQNHLGDKPVYWIIFPLGYISNSQLGTNNVKMGYLCCTPYDHIKKRPPALSYLENCLWKVNKFEIDTPKKLEAVFSFRKQKSYTKLQYTTQTNQKKV